MFRLVDFIRRDSEPCFCEVPGERKQEQQQLFPPWWHGFVLSLSYVLSFCIPEMVTAKQTHLQLMLIGIVNQGRGRDTWFLATNQIKNSAT